MADLNFQFINLLFITITLLRYRNIKMYIRFLKINLSFQDMLMTLLLKAMMMMRRKA